MRPRTVSALHASSVILSFVLILEGPDLLLLAVLDARLWFPVGLASGLLTLPLLWTAGVGFVPPWTMPYFGADTPLRRVVAYHLTCCVFAAWLWTEPTLRTVAWVHERRGGEAAVGPLAADLGSVAGGLVLAALLFFVPALLLFVRLSAFRTGVDLYEARASDLLRPGVVGIGSALLAGGIVALVVVATGP